MDILQKTSVCVRLLLAVLKVKENLVIRFTGRDGLKTGGKGLGVEVGGSRRQQEDREKNPQSLRDL